MVNIDSEKLQAAIKKANLTCAELSRKCEFGGDKTVNRIIKRGYCLDPTAHKIASVLKTGNFILGTKSFKGYPSAERCTVCVNSDVLFQAKKSFLGSEDAFRDISGIHMETAMTAARTGRCRLRTAKAIAKGFNIPLESFVLDSVPEQIEITETVDEPDEAAAERMEEPKAVPTNAPTKKPTVGGRIFSRLLKRTLQDIAERCEMDYERVEDIVMRDAEPTLSEIVTIAEAADLSLDELLKGV